MTEHVLAVASDNAPWRSETPWWATGIQGVVLFVIGIYFLAAPGSAGSFLIQLIALALLVQCALNIVGGLRVSRDQVDPYIMLQSGVGATVGLLVLFRSFLVPTLDISSARTILGLGLIAYVLIEVAGTLVDRAEGVTWLNRGVTGILLLVLAIMLLSSGRENAADRLAVLGWIMIVGGILLVLLAFLSNRRSAAPAESLTR